MSKVINASHRLSCKLLVVITTFSILGSTTNLTPSIVYAQSSLPDQALSRATEEYARDIGISLSEAIHRLTLQNSIGELDVAFSQKEAASYGGLWIQHQPSFKVIVQMTSGNEQLPLQYLSKLQIPKDIVEVRSVKFTLSHLQALQDLSTQKLRISGVNVDTGINIFNNSVDINVIDPQEVQVILSQKGILLPSEIVVLKVPELIKPAANIYAGLSINCTTGFSVKNPSGTKGISTAAHCANSQSYLGVNLPLVAEAYSGSNDIQWHSVGSHTVKNYYQAGGTAYLVNSITNRNSQAINSYICKSGVTTGYACGYITDKNVNPGYIPGGGNATFIRLHKDISLLANDGDSGGPVFSGNSAYGIISGSQAIPLGRDAIYMAVDYFSSINVTICTTDPC